MASVLRRDQAGVRILTMNRPEVRNALDTAMLAAMDVEIRRAREDAVRCLVLEGAGVDFGAGGDVKEPGAEQTPEYLDRFWGLAISTTRDLHTLPCPTIAVIQGNVLGMSLEYALACDLRFAADNAKFRMGFDRLATTPEVLSAVHLPRLLGIDRAKYFFFSGEVWSGEEAFRAGLATKVFAEDKLRDEALAVAQALGSGPTRAFAAGKEMMDLSFERSTEQNLKVAHDSGLAMARTEDAVEAMNAAVEKREPVFRGR